MNVKKRWTVVMIGMLALAPLSFAKETDKAKAEQERLRNADTVMKEISKSRQHTAGAAGQGTLCCGDAIGAQGGVRCGRQLRTRDDGLPHGQRFFWSVGAPAMYALEAAASACRLAGKQLISFSWS